MRRFAFARQFSRFSVSFLYRNNRIGSFRSLADVAIEPGKIELKDNPKDMYVMFTCTVCDTRSIKGFSRQSYEEGVVLARCPGCKNLHLIADNLRYFADKRINIEDIAKEKEGMCRVVQDSIELTAEDIIGRTAVEKLSKAQLEKVD
jgi:protein import protein ZIM17